MISISIEKCIHSKHVNIPMKWIVFIFFVCFAFFKLQCHITSHTIQLVVRIERKMKLIVLLIFAISLENVYGWRTFWKGHRRGGNLIAPHGNLSRAHLPPDQWFDQKLDHFTPTNNELWKQVTA